MIALAATMLDLSPLKDRYQIGEDPCVVAFFARHPEAIATLVEAHPHILDAFHPQVTVRLEAPYFEDEDQLFAQVQGHGMDAVEAMEVFEARFTPWWHTLSPQKTMKLIIGAAPE